MLSDADSDNDDNGEDLTEEDESLALTQTYLLKSLHSTQLTDLVSSTTHRSASTASQRALLARLDLDIDKALLQLLALECRAGGGDERGMRALEIVGLMRDRSGRMIEAAGKVAERYSAAVLRGKIRELGERRVEGGDEDEEGEEDE